MRHRSIAGQPVISSHGLTRTTSGRSSSIPRSGADSRFSTIYHKGAVLPVLYGGEDNVAVASETIFHTVDLPTSTTRPRHVFLLKFLSWQWSTIETRRELRLVRLDDDGLAQIGSSREDLIEGARATYAFTRQRGDAIAAAVGRAGRRVVVLTAGARPMGGRALPEGAWAVGGSAAWRSGRCRPCPAFRPANGNRATGRGRSPLRYDRCEALTDELTLSSNRAPGLSLLGLADGPAPTV